MPASDIPFEKLSRIYVTPQARMLRLGQVGAKESSGPGWASFVPVNLEGETSLGIKAKVQVSWATIRIPSTVEERGPVRTPRTMVSGFPENYGNKSGATRPAETVSRVVLHGASPPRLEMLAPPAIRSRHKRRKHSPARLL